MHLVQQPLQVLDLVPIEAQGGPAPGPDEYRDPQPDGHHRPGQPGQRPPRLVEDHQQRGLIGPDRFARDVERSLAAIERACGVRPNGYRAPSFSIDRRSLWAFDVLAAQGIEYDSSVFPVRHPRYGIPAFSRTPCRVRTPAGHDAS